MYAIQIYFETLKWGKANTCQTEMAVNSIFVTTSRNQHALYYKKLNSYLFDDKITPLLNFLATIQKITLKP